MINRFIQEYGLRPADALILRKKLFGMVDHYAIYLGMYKGEHVFVANYTKGVRIISNDQMYQFLQFLEPTAIEPFHGTLLERNKAINRAESRVNEDAYDYLSNNCEHFKNWVHHGEHISEQAENFGSAVKTVVGGLAIFGLLAAIVDDK